jgi:anti-sigma28 factor (negative regulator of flagellin synthesis)
MTIKILPPFQPKPAAGDTAAAPRKAGGDVVSFSEVAREVQAAREADEQQQRADRVAELKRKVNSGQYRPDTREMALYLLLDDREPLL